MANDLPSNVIGIRKYLHILSPFMRLTPDHFTKGEKKKKGMILNSIETK